MNFWHLWHEISGSTENKITEYKHGENVEAVLEIVEAVLVHDNSDYQQVSRVLYTFVLNKPFGQLLKISHKLVL